MLSSQVLSPFVITLFLCYLILALLILVSAYFFLVFKLPCNSMSVSVHISNLVGEPLVLDRVYRSCLITLVGYET